MRFLKLTLAYDGTEYAGWQTQPNAPTVQSTLEAAWKKVTQEDAKIIASGRTDAGVHAYGQVCSIQTETALDNVTLVRALGANTPFDIVIREIESASQGFHAIRDAIRKRYCYSIQSGNIRDPFARRYCWHLPQELNVSAMAEACQILVGEHDFASFQASGSERTTTVRNVLDLQVIDRGRGLADKIDIEIEANGFLYNMVRNIVGSLVEIGKGKQTVQWMTDVLAAKNRDFAGPTAPPQGLFLVQVWY